MEARTEIPAVEAIGTIDEALDDYRLSLRAQNKTRATLAVYGAALERLNTYLKQAGMPTKLAAIRREHLEAFLVSLIEEGKAPATVSVYYRSLQPFWRWAIEEGEIDTSPMANMKPPKVPEKPVELITLDEKAALLKVVSRGKAFEDRRDEAILRLLMDTGMRRDELAGLTLDDVQIDLSDRGDHFAIVTGKGRLQRTVPFGDEAAVALRRYRAKRATHPKAIGTDALWIGFKGPLSGNAVLQMVERRGRQAGIERKLFVHLFRHMFNHEAAMQGLSEGARMQIAGWRSPQMLRRYGSSAAAERARAEYHRVMGGKR